MAYRGFKDSVTDPVLGRGGIGYSDLQDSYIKTYNYSRLPMSLRQIRIKKQQHYIPKRNQDAGYFISSSLHAFSRDLLNAHGFPIKPSGMTAGVIPAPSSSLCIYPVIPEGFCRKSIPCDSRFLLKECRNDEVPSRLF